MPKKPLSHSALVASGKAPKTSKAKNPCQTAWEVFSDAKQKLGATFTRKAAIDRALAAGVAYYTARTQYQCWKEAGDRDARRAAQYSQHHGSK